MLYVDVLHCHQAKVSPDTDCSSKDTSQCGSIKPRLSMRLSMKNGSRRSSIARAVETVTTALGNVLSAMQGYVGSTKLIYNVPFARPSNILHNSMSWTDRYDKILKESEEVLTSFVQNDVPEIINVAVRTELLLRSGRRCIERVRTLSETNDGEDLLDQTFAKDGSKARPLRVLSKAADLKQCESAHALTAQLSHVLQSNTRLPNLPPEAGQGIIIMRLALERKGTELNGALTSIKASYAAHETRGKKYANSRAQSSVLMDQYNERESEFQASIDQYITLVDKTLKEIAELRTELENLKQTNKTKQDLVLPSPQIHPSPRRKSRFSAIFSHFAARRATRTNSAISSERTSSS